MIVCLPAFPAAWLAGAVAARIVFPITFATIWLGPLGMALAMTIFLIPRACGITLRRRGASAAVACVGLMIGAAAILVQRPPPPATHPLSEKIADDEAPAGPTRVAPGAIALGAGTMVYTWEGSLNVRIAPLTVSVSPLLRFLSRSADGCWTVLARPADRAGPEPRLQWARKVDDATWHLAYSFPGQGPARLHLNHDPARESVVVDARTRLDNHVFSHLNSFCDVEVRGHRRLNLEFSPCQGAIIEVTKYDYPFGRPARFAYVDEARRFRVVEASSGEKGPFRVLAEGRLEPADPLEIRLYDNDRPIVRFCLLDWSAQASTELSPTAGWGVPDNAIEFSLSGNEPTSPASLFITLAGTSVGRGWDSVGHAAGTYRNRITIESGTDP